MKPILFAENSTTFTTNGIGRLSDAISCIVTEQRNGMYELEMEYPITGKHYTDLGMRKILYVKPSLGASRQPFRIYEISNPDFGRVIVRAQHISYDLSKNVAMPFSVAMAPTACNSALQGLKSHAVESCPFTFWTNVTTASSYSQLTPASIRQQLGGIEGSILDQFGGEYEFDGYAVKLHLARGTDNGVTLRYGKNITDLQQEKNIANTITGVVPFWINMDGTEYVELPEKAVYSPNASRYSHNLTIPLDLSDKWDEKPDVSTLRLAAQAYIGASNIGVPAVSVKVSFVNLRNTEEYADIAALESVNLCDDIHVQFEPLGIDTTAEVVETVWDVLMERYDSVTIGELRSSLAMTINDQNMHTAKEIDKTRVQTSNAINNATKWLTSAGGWVIAIKNEDGSWKELIFSNNKDPFNDHAQILRINNAGIGFAKYIDASHKGGINGYYRNAWTIDGNLVADFIHGGTLTLGGSNNGNGVMSFVDANGREIIRIDRTGAYFYSWVQVNGTWTKTTIGSWTPSGIDVRKGSIHGASLSLGANGGDNNADGTLTIYGWNSQTNQRYVIGTWTKDGLTVNKGSITGGSINGASVTLGGNNNASGTLTIKDGNNTVKGTWNNAGLNVNGVCNISNDGTITSKNNNNRTTSISGGKITIETPSGGVYDQIQFKRGEEYVEMGAHRVFYNDGEGHSVNATWEKIIEAANRSTS